ncbi:hypothetical protein SAMN05192553_103322 [Cyclobacterium xiamenense]|uniref:Uncharacterized protein n=1 Tax=Cyclobacterium xiamenense TaxID=1297121 RepID=A0A1H6XZW4_9BACT|nr:hypothetical protein SAMN05192553_103322 [Cyclobacterium xiamenense]
MYWSLDTFFQQNLRLNENEKLKLIKTYIKNLKNEKKKRG